MSVPASTPGWATGPAPCADLDVLDRLNREQAELLKMRERIRASPTTAISSAVSRPGCSPTAAIRTAWAVAMAALTNQPNHPATCRLLADYYARHPGQAGLANFYRLKAEQETAAAVP